MCSLTRAACSLLFCDAHVTGEVCAHARFGDAPVCVPPSLTDLSLCLPGDCTCNFGPQCLMSPAQCRRDYCGGHGTCVHHRAPRSAGEPLCVCDGARYGVVCQYATRRECSDSMCTAGFECALNRHDLRAQCEDTSSGLHIIASVVVIVGSIILVFAMGGFCVAMARDRDCDPCYGGRTEGIAFRGPLRRLYRGESDHTPVGISTGYRDSNSYFAGEPESAPY